MEFYEILMLLFFVAMVAGFIDSMAGGGGLIVIPALLAAGLPPAATLATNKLQACFGSFSAAFHFFRSGELDLRRLWPWFVASVAASGLGSLLVLQIDPSFLRIVLPVLLVAMAFYFWFFPGVGAVDARQRLSVLAFGLTAVPLIAFYDGFFGPGTGSFFALAFVGLMGFNLRRATAHAKLVNFGSNLGSLMVFIAGGKVVWTIGLVMGAGQYLGARLGAGLVIKRGAALVRPMLVLICLATTAKLLFDEYGSAVAAVWMN